jgi:rare lipoprotein A (peptidoglycan hydrolase)
MSVTSRLTGYILLFALSVLPACSTSMKGVGDYDVLNEGYKERGYASWYGAGFHGRPTASGEIYDQNKMTAAHRILPLGSVVRVINAENGKMAEVTINDRGPFVNGRIIDLSLAAAEGLGMVKAGTSPVMLEVVRMGNERPDGFFARLNRWEKSRSGSKEAHGLKVDGATRNWDAWFLPDGTQAEKMGRRMVPDMMGERRPRRLFDLLIEEPQPGVFV